jgi:hypothetical protein
MLTSARLAIFQTIHIAPLAKQPSTNIPSNFQSTSSPGPLSGANSTEAFSQSGTLDDDHSCATYWIALWLLLIAIFHLPLFLADMDHYRTGHWYLHLALSSPGIKRLASSAHRSLNWFDLDHDQKY